MNPGPTVFPRGRPRSVETQEVTAVFASGSRSAARPAAVQAVSTASHASALEAPMQTLTFQRRQTLYHAGDAAQSVFRVRDGLVRITRMTPEGRILTVRHLVPGDFFGEEAFMDGKRDEIAEALTTARSRRSTQP
jgi:CRP-like cAMP-binding protein